MSLLSAAAAPGFGGSLATGAVGSASELISIRAAASLARFAHKLGGGKYSAYWSDYLSKKRRIPFVDKLVICLYFADRKPQDLFPSWRSLPERTPAALTKAIASLLRALLSLENSGPDVLGILLLELLVAQPTLCEGLEQKARRLART